MKLHRESLQLARARYGWSIARTAEEAGISNNSVLRAEHEEEVSVGTVHKLAAALKVDVGELVGEPALAGKALGPDRQREGDEPAGPGVLDRGDATSAAAVWRTEYENRLDEMLDRWEGQLEERVEDLAAGKRDAFFAWLAEIERYGRPQVSGIVAAHTATAAHEFEAMIEMNPFLQAWGDLWRSIEEANDRHGVKFSEEDEKKFHALVKGSLALR